MASSDSSVSRSRSRSRSRGRRRRRRSRSSSDEGSRRKSSRRYSSDDSRSRSRHRSKKRRRRSRSSSGSSRSKSPSRHSNRHNKKKRDQPYQKNPRNPPPPHNNPVRTRNIQKQPTSQRVAKVESVVSFPAWAKTQREKGKPITDDGYNEYVNEWKRAKEDAFFKRHGKDQFFRNKYDVFRRQSIQEDRRSLSRDLAQEALKICDDSLAEDGQVTDEKAWNRDFPDLDSAEVKKGKTGTGGLAVGQRVDPECVVVVTKIPFHFPLEQVIDGINAALSGTEGNLGFECMPVVQFPTGTAKQPTQIRFDRDFYVVFEEKEAAQKLLTTVKSFEHALGDTLTLRLSFIPPRHYGNRPAFAEVSQPLRYKWDLTQALNLAVALDKYCEIEDGINTLLQKPCVKAYIDSATDSREGDLEKCNDDDEKQRFVTFCNTMAKERRKLDIVLGYLRLVHLCSYYGMKVYENKGAMLFGCSLPYLRQIAEDWLSSFRRYEELVTEAEDKEDLGKIVSVWVEQETKNKERSQTRKLDENIKGLIQYYSADAVEQRRKEMECKLEKANEVKNKATEEFCEEHTKKEGTDKYRCTLHPFKAFKTTQFLRKHIETKQTELLEKAVSEAMNDTLKQEFYDDSTKLIGVIPDYAKPKPRAQNYLTQYGGGSASYGQQQQQQQNTQVDSFSRQLAYHQNNQQQQQFQRGQYNQHGGPPQYQQHQQQRASQQPPKRAFRTVVDYSDL